MTKMLLRSTTVLSLLLLLASNEALRILVVFPLASKSHSILGHGVVNRLLDAGHEVVHLTSTPRDQQERNLREVTVPDVLSKLIEADPESFNALTLKNMVGQPNFGDSMFFFNFTFGFHKLFLEEKTVVDFLGDPKEKFDAIIVEWFFSDVIAGIAPLFQCPLIWLAPTEAHWQVLKLVDTMPSPALNVDIFSKSTSPLHLWERTMELWNRIKKITMMKLVFIPREQTLYDTYFSRLAAKRGIMLPSYEQAVYNGSMLLLNSHPSIGTPFSLPQNAKYVGGYHIDVKAKPLPEYLQNLMDFARYGVIYFSMGSNLKSSDMSAEMRDSILDVFSKFKQRIIWKYEAKLENVPKNVFLVKWAPQQSILAHPTLRIFITNGGQLSITEAIHYGVPVIGIPVMADQYLNMDAVVRKGFGLKLKLADDIADQMGVAMTKMLVNPAYKMRAKEISQVYQHRPVSSRKELVHWVEHVVRTGGAPHLRSPALMMPWYQKMYLDLAALVVLVLIIVFDVSKVIFYIIVMRQRQRIKTLKKNQKSMLNKVE